MDIPAGLSWLVTRSRTYLKDTWREPALVPAAVGAKQFHHVPVVAVLRFAEGGPLVDFVPYVNPGPFGQQQLCDGSVSVHRREKERSSAMLVDDIGSRPTAQKRLNYCGPPAHRSIVQ